MTDERARADAHGQAAHGQAQQAPAGGNMAGRFLGSLKDALAAASRDDTAKLMAAGPQTPPPLPASHAAAAPARPAAAPAAQPAVAPAPAAAPAAKPAAAPPPSPSAAEAAREARAIAAPTPPVAEPPPTTRVVKPAAKAAAAAAPPAAARTALVRGKAPVKRGEFHQDPVVGWLVVVGGPGLGAYRPVFEGNNTIGRDAGQRIPLDFGDDAISSQEQAYIRYDSGERSFLFVPNLAKTNVVSVNNKRPTAAVELAAMDVIGLGRTQVVFVPFCGADFDWAEIADAKA